MRATAQNHGSYFDELLKAGFYRHEALELAKILAMENFRAVFTAKPTKPPEK